MFFFFSFTRFGVNSQKKPKKTWISRFPERIAVWEDFFGWHSLILILVLWEFHCLFFEFSINRICSSHSGISKQWETSFSNKGSKKICSLEGARRSVHVQWYFRREFVEGEKRSFLHSVSTFHASSQYSKCHLENSPCITSIPSSHISIPCLWDCSPAKLWGTQVLVPIVRL